VWWVARPREDAQLLDRQSWQGRLRIEFGMAEPIGVELGTFQLSRP
jgi:hypothetical protein